MSRQSLLTRRAPMEIAMQRLEGFRVTFEKVVRIVSGRKVNVVFAEGNTAPIPGAPGWTDGKYIWLNRDEFLTAIFQGFTNDIIKAVGAMKGVLYHELSHVIYTPRMDSKFIKKLRDEATKNKRDLMFGVPVLWLSWNILEDQRIERLLFTRYETIGEFFRLTVLQWMSRTLHDSQAQNEDLSGRLYPLVAKRLYLDDGFLSAVRANFIAEFDEALADEVDSVVGAYTRLPFSRGKNYRKAMSLIREFAAILRKINPPQALVDMPSNSKHGLSQIAPSKGKVSQRDEDDAWETGEVDNDGEERFHRKPKDEEGDDGLDDEDEGQGSSGNGDSDEAAAGDGSAGAGDQSSGSDKGQEGEGSDERGSGGGAGRGKRAPRLIPLDELVKKIDKAIDETTQESDSGVRKEAKGIIDKAFKWAEDNRPLTMDKEALGERHVDVTMDRNVTAVLEALKRLRNELEEHWEQEQPFGRVNVQAVMRTRHDPGNLDVFDIWQPSQTDRAGLEVVLCVDGSGSMAHSSSVNGDYHYVEAGKAAWVIKRVMDIIGQPCTVLSFHGTCSVVHDRNERVDERTFKVFDQQGGSTEPLEAIRQGLSLLAMSRKPHKLLCMVTDGQWTGTETPACEFLLGKAGDIYTALFGLNNAVGRYGAHRCRFARNVGSASEVAKFVTDLVMEFSRTAQGRIV